MITQLMHPQEVEVFYVIPTLRRYLAHFLKKQGLSQKLIAEIFMVRESTISQYFNAKRAALVTFPQAVADEIEVSAGRIKTHMDVIREMQRLLQLIRESRTLCDIHRRFSTIKLDCDPLVTGCVPYREALT